MDVQRRPLTDRELKAWLAGGETNRSIGEGLTFVASAGAAIKGKASWVLRFRLHGRLREKVLGRYPELSLKDAREQARKDRSLIERGVDVAAQKQLEKAQLSEAPTVQKLGELWMRKMELLSARWEDFDLDRQVWRLAKSKTKTKADILIPLADPVVGWLKEARILGCGSPFVFPARRLVRERLGVRRVNRVPHVGPDTLNVALRRLAGLEIEHFTVHDMRRTARTNMARLGVDRFVAERALNHKLKGVEGIYDRHDYFFERLSALQAWADLLAALAGGKKAKELIGPSNRHREAA